MHQILEFVVFSLALMLLLSLLLESCNILDSGKSLVSLTFLFVLFNHFFNFSVDG